MEKKQMIGVDRLSSLHNFLLIHILSFLPSKDAARTCILSRGWRNSWTSLPNLHFDITKPDHMDFIDRLLARRTESDNINSFHLVCHDNWLGLTDRVGAWIDYALQHNVKRLNLQLGSSAIAPFQFFDILMRNQSLESLEVHGTNVQPPVRTQPDSGCFSKLRVLHLYLRGDEIRDNWIGRLISGCPVLEDAVVCALLSALEISAPNLKRLKVYGQLDCEVIQISCPRLEVFEIHLMGVRSFQANELVNLEKAVIKIGFYSLYDNLVVDQTLAMLYHVRYLELSLQGHLFEKQDWPLKMFYNLRKLEVKTSFHSSGIEALICLLEHTPNLTHLTVIVFPQLVDNWKPRKLSSKLCHLEAVSIVRRAESRFVANTREFVKFLSDNVEAWDKVTKDIDDQFNPVKN